MLSDQGASSVIKVEPPAGTMKRALGPPVSADGDAAYFTAVNRGKRAIEAGPGPCLGAARCCCACWNRPTCWSNFIPGTMARVGLDYEADLSRAFPN